MSEAILKIFLIVILCSMIKAKNDKYKGPSQEDVIQLDPNTYQNIVYESDQTWFIELYAEWCGHCQTLRPEWAKFATKMKGIAKVAKIDPSDNKYRPHFYKTYGLEGFPRIIMIPAGRKVLSVYEVYDGARTSDSIEQWAYQKIKKHQGFIVERLTSQDVWKSNCLQTGASICVIVFLPTLVDSTATQRQVYLQTIRTSANNFRDKPASFLWAQGGDHPQFEDQFNLHSGFPATILINPGRRLFSIMKSSLTQQNLTGWLEDIVNRRGGRRFGQYSKQLQFNKIQVQPEESIDDNNFIEVEL